MSRARARGARSRKGRGGKKVNKAARAAAEHSHTDAGPDRIVCLLCGETYRAITYWHLRRIHGFEGEHPVQDYKEMFGLEVAVCEEVRERAREIQVDRHKKAGRHWTKAKILREIRKRRRSEHGLAHSRAPLGLTIAARRMFGSWDDALLAAGVDPTEHRFTNAWDEDRLANAIRHHARGGRAVTSSWVKEADPELHRAAIRLVGNWTAAIRAAGLKPDAHREPKRWAMERVVAWVKDTHAAGGSIRSSEAPPGALGRVRQETMMPWSRFVESLGIPYPGPKPRRDWTKSAVIAEIRKRRRGGLPLHVGGMTGKALTLYQQGARRFGSWDEALRAAGLDPSEIRKHRVWTRDDVLAAIRTRDKAGNSMAYRDAIRDDPRLVRAATRIFPTSWTKAIAAAGLDPGRARRDGRAGRRGPRRRK